jgi:RNA polymerase sigma-70 factor, ECF subfamily
MAGVTREILNCGIDDAEIVSRVRAGETALYEILMRRHNQRMFRIARGILGNDAEAEDVMQEAYVRAFVHLDQFEGRAKFSTWLARIAVHECLARLRRREGTEEIDAAPGWEERHLDALPRQRDPEMICSNEELRRVLETAVDRLPEGYRAVFVLREIEELSTHETAEALGITGRAAKIRLHRARAALRKQIYHLAGAGASSAFPLHLERCDRVVSAVFKRLAPSGTTE